MIFAIRDLVSKILPQSVKDTIVDIRDPIAAFLHHNRPQIPPPHSIKSRAVISLGHRHNVRLLIETGTFHGEMARKCSKHFKQIWTIELSETLAADSAMRLAGRSNIHVLCGESTAILPQILAGIHEPVVFWLDAHYSGGVTAKGVTECPLERELKLIAGHECHAHIILIDDVRLLGIGDYPSLDEVCELARRINPRYKIEVLDDILRCEPNDNNIQSTGSGVAPIDQTSLQGCHPKLNSSSDWQRTPMNELGGKLALSLLLFIITALPFHARRRSRPINRALPHAS